MTWDCPIKTARRLTRTVHTVCSTNKLHGLGLRFNGPLSMGDSFIDVLPEAYYLTNNNTPKRVKPEIKNRNSRPSQAVPILLQLHSCEISSFSNFRRTSEHTSLYAWKPRPPLLPISSPPLRPCTHFAFPCTDPETLSSFAWRSRPSSTLL